MKLYFLPPLISGIIISLVGHFAFSKFIATKNKEHLALFLACMSLSVWLIGYSGMYASRDEGLGLIWAKIGFIGVIFIPITFYHFTVEVLKIKSRIPIRTLYLTSIPFIILAPTNYIYKGLNNYFWGFYPQIGILYHFFPILFFILFMYSFLLLLINFKKSEKKDYIKYNQAKYLMFAYLFANAGIVDFLPKYGIEIYPFGYLAAVSWISLIAYAIIKYRLMNSNFSFVIHTTDINLLSIALNMPWLSKIPYGLLKRIFMMLPPFKCSHISGVSSLTGRKIEGDLIFCPLLPEQILNLNHEFVLKKIIKAGRIAKGNGAKILGLGAYTAQVGRKGVLVSKALNMPVTTGSSYTAAVTMDAIFEAAKKVCINLSESKAAVIGATGGIGKVCSQVLSAHVPHIVLIARNQERLDNLAKLIHEKNNTINIETTTNTSKETISDCDIIIIVTNDPMLLIDIKAVKSGAVICDVSQPPNISKQDRESRNDILIIDGGIVKPHGNVNFNFYFGLPPGLAFACMAETMILALEEKYEPYSIGGNITLEKVLEISKLAAKHGFMLSDLKSSGKQVLTKEIDSIRKYIQTKYSYA